MSIPNELVQGIVDIKTAIENKSADTPVEIPDREYPDELCEALGAVKDAIENSQGGGGEVLTQYGKTLTITNGYSSNSVAVSYMVVGESGELSTAKITNLSMTTSARVKEYKPCAMFDGNKILLTIPRTDLAVANKVNCEVEVSRIEGDNTNSNVIVTISDTTADASFTFNKQTT